MVCNRTINTNIRYKKRRCIIQLGFKHNIIDNGEKWIDMMIARNSLSHMYDKDFDLQKTYEEYQKTKELSSKEKFFTKKLYKNGRE